MVSAKATPSALPLSEGVGEVDLARAADVVAPPNPNLALNAFLALDPSGGPVPLFDAASWGNTARANASWGSASWGSASWGSASWGSASWGSASWGSASWGSASWGSAAWSAASWGTASWGTASWGTASWGDASWGDASWGSSAVSDNAVTDFGVPYLLDPVQEALAAVELGLTIGSDGTVGVSATSTTQLP
jgi:hypothetical protein